MTDLPEGMVSAFACVDKVCSQLVPEGSLWNMVDVITKRDAAWRKALDEAQARLAEVERENERLRAGLESVARLRVHIDGIDEDCLPPGAMQSALVLLGSNRPLERVTTALAASQAECAELREALDGYVVIDEHSHHHGLHKSCSLCAAPWKDGSFTIGPLVHNASCLLSRPTGTQDALRAVCEKVAHAAKGPRPTRIASDGGEYYLTDEEWNAHIVARVLKEVGKP